jgi:outer membrane protein OmpA-like peptidoglycan-associated protein
VGNQAYNQKLSEERAEAVKEYLLNVGTAEERLSSKGYGYTRPVATNETAKGRAQDRRVELTPMP